MSGRGDRDPYRELGIGPEAGPAEIRAAFRAAARRHHPDTASRGGDGSAVRGAIDAYRLLSDPVARAGYDARREAVADRAAPLPPAATRACPSCSGWGVVPVAVACPACRGRAEVTDLTGPRGRVVRCRTCLGSGRVRSARRCNRCRGTGVVA